MPRGQDGVGRGASTSALYFAAAAAAAAAKAAVAAALLSGSSPLSGKHAFLRYQAIVMV